MPETGAPQSFFATGTETFPFREDHWPPGSVWHFREHVIDADLRWVTEQTVRINMGNGSDVIAKGVELARRQQEDPNLDMDRAAREMAAGMSMDSMRVEVLKTRGRAWIERMSVRFEGAAFFMPAGAVDLTAEPDEDGQYPPLPWAGSLPPAIPDVFPHLPPAVVTAAERWAAEFYDGQAVRRPEQAAQFPGATGGSPEPKGRRRAQA